MELTAERAAAEVEKFACPTCGAPAMSPCRTRGGQVAGHFHTARFILVPGLGKAEEVAVAAGRRPGAPWSAPQAPATVRIGYACAPAPDKDLSGQLSELAAAGCARTFAETASLAARVRPELTRALRLAAEQRRCAENQPVIFSVCELGGLARTASELFELARMLSAADVTLQLHAGPLAGMYNPSGTGSMLFAVLAAAAQLDHDYRSRQIRAGQRAAAARGYRGGRPRVLDDAMLSLARRLRDDGVPVPEIARKLVIPAGVNAGRHPSLASVYRALAEPAAPADAPTRGPLPESSRERRSAAAGTSRTGTSVRCGN